MESSSYSCETPGPAEALEDDTEQEESGAGPIENGMPHCAHCMESNGNGAESDNGGEKYGASQSEADHSALSRLDALFARADGSSLSPAPQSLGYADVFEAARRLEGVAHRTPVMTSRLADERAGAHLFFKCESFQRSGSFKFRGAYNAISRLSARQKHIGALTYSSGNHGQALALAGQMLDTPVTVIMPEDAPRVKIEATRAYGARIILHDRMKTRREDIARQLAAEEGLVLIPPFDHPDIIAGQGTAARELFEQAGVMDWLLVCCGGGGLLSGCAIAASALSPGCRVAGVEPERADDATRSFRTKTLQSVENPDTICDGARTAHLGEITFPLILEYVTDMATVSEEEIIETVRFLAEKMKILVEPTGALAAAAALNRKFDFAGQRIGVIISGGNADLSALGRLFQGATPP